MLLELGGACFHSAPFPATGAILRRPPAPAQQHSTSDQPLITTCHAAPRPKSSVIRHCPRLQPPVGTPATSNDRRSSALSLSLSLPPFNPHRPPTPSASPNHLSHGFQRSFGPEVRGHCLTRSPDGTSCFFSPCTLFTPGSVSGRVGSDATTACWTPRTAPHSRPRLGRTSLFRSERPLTRTLSGPLLLSLRRHGALDSRPPLRF